MRPARKKVHACMPALASGWSRANSSEVADTMLDACERLLERCPEAQIWGVRAGYLAVHSFGGWPLPEEP